MESGKVTVSYAECTLDPYIIRGSVTGFAVAHFFYKALKRYGLHDGMTPRLPYAITTDKASNCVVAFRTLPANIAWIPCFSHVLQRGIMAAMKSIRKGRSMQRLIDLAKYMSRSEVV